MANDNSNDIHIILNKSVNATKFSDVNLIHREEFDRTIGIIENSKEKAIQYKPSVDEDHLHDAITILGTRGSGKTSFLLSVRDKYDNDAHVKVLSMIDPTLIEEKGHVFLTVIAVICEVVEDKLKETECNPHKETHYSRKSWRQQLLHLAAGLPSIDGIGAKDMDHWQDPEFVMDTGLQAVKSAIDLEKNFNKLLEMALTILGKKAFLITFDDIDVDATKGMSVLETIRKYFVMPRLITLVSGDLKLYSTVIRQKKWEKFGQELLKYEGKQLKKLNNFNDMITELESQYLQKVLQPRNRIHLHSINEAKQLKPDTRFLIFANEDDVAAFNLKEAELEKEIKANANQQELADDLETQGGLTVSKEMAVKKNVENDIKEVYISILRGFGIHNPYQAEAYYSFLMGLPIRSQIQFLCTFELKEGKYLPRNNDVTRLIDVFISDLHEKDIDAFAAIKNAKYLNRIILKFLIKEKKLEELYQLQPITTDNSLNASLFSLSLLFSARAQKNEPHLIFDYLIKVGYIRNLLPLVGYRKSNESAVTPSIEDLCDNAVIMNDNVLKDVVGKIIAYVRGTLIGKETNHESLLKAGTIPLFGKAATSKGSASNNSYRIDAVLRSEGADFVQWVLTYIPLSSNQYTFRDASILTYSPYLLLATIGELIRKVQLDNERNGFVELSQLRSYMMPDFSSAVNHRSSNYDEDNLQDFPLRDKKNVKIEALLKSWVRSYPKDLKLSPHVLGKISTRFYFTLTRLENTQGKRSLGEIFHAYIVAFMNAVLIEDCRENYDDAASMNMNNTNFSNKVLTDNLWVIIGAKAKSTPNNKKGVDSNYIGSAQLMLSRWLLSCPLFLAYLNMDDAVLINYIKTFCEASPKTDPGINIPEEIFKLNIFSFLKEVAVKDEPTAAVSKKEASLTTLSLGRKANHMEVRSRLNNAGIDLEIFNTAAPVEIDEKLKHLNIINATAKNIEAFSQFLKDQI